LLSLDIDLSRKEIQDLASPDSIASFLARLGYDTNSRVIQTPANPGITAEGTAKSIG